MNQPGLDAYVAYFEQLSPDRLADLGDVVCEEVHFRDPFNDVTGLEAMQRILRAMFDDIASPKFIVTHRSWDGDVAFLRWTFTGQLKRLANRPWTVTGMTELRFSDDGRVAAHLDYWDAGQGFYELIPGLGAVIRYLRRRIAAG